MIIAFPRHRKLVRFLNSIPKMFSNVPTLEHVRAITFNGKDGSISIRFQPFCDVAGKEKVNFCHSLQAAWREFPTFYEADLWEDVLQEKIAEEDMRDWVARVIWWNRHEVAEGEHAKKWREFMDRHDGIYESDIAVVEKLASKFLKEHEMEKILRNGSFHGKLIDDQLRRRRAWRAIADYEEALLQKNLKKVGFA